MHLSQLKANTRDFSANAHVICETKDLFFDELSTTFFFRLHSWCFLRQDAAEASI